MITSWLHHGQIMAFGRFIHSLRQDHDRVLNSQALITKNDQIVKPILAIRSNTHVMDALRQMIALLDQRLLSL
jgi:hypothetical protein